MMAVNLEINKLTNYEVRQEYFRELPVQPEEQEFLSDALVDFCVHLRREYLKISNARYFMELIGSLALACLPKGKTLNIHGLHFKVNQEIFEEANKIKCLNLNDLLKEFFLSCRRSAVTQHLSESHQFRYIIEKLPRKDQWQYSAGHKALCTASDFDIKKKEQEWKDIFVPTYKRFETMQNQSKSEKSGGWVHRNVNLPLPSNKKWIKRGACFETKASEGGALTSIRKFFRQSELNALMSKSLSEQIRSLPFFFKEIASNCEAHLKSLFNVNVCPLGERDHDKRYILECSPECKHPYLYHMVILNSPQGKVRMCTMLMSSMLYLQSILQKLLTFAMKNLLVAKEGLSSSPDFVGAIRRSIQFTQKKWYFHSGDLSDCTNHYSYKTSRALCKNLLKSYSEDLSRFDWLIDLSFGPYNIIRQSPAFEKIRSADVEDYFRALVYAQERTWFTSKLGQHLSSPLSFPNMAMMHAEAYAVVNPKQTETYHTAKFKDRTVTQLYSKMMKLEYGSYFYYMIGISDKGIASRFRGDEMLKCLAYFAYCFHQLGVYWELYMADFEPGVEYSHAYMIKSYDPWCLQPEEITGFEYKSNYSNHYVPGEMIAFYPNKNQPCWLPFFQWRKPYPIPVFRLISNLTPPIVNYLSDQEMEKLTPETVSQDQLYESLNIRWDHETASIKRMHRNSFLHTVGDDHLHWTQEKNLLTKYSKVLKTRYNQKYNLKADFISTTGAVIAEHCIEINQEKHKVHEICFIRPKQLLEEEPDAIQWIDKLRSIAPTFKQIFLSKNLKSRQIKYKKIIRAQEIFIQNHKNYFRKYTKLCVSPYLPYHLGGLGVHGYTKWNNTTRMHLENLNFLVIFSEELLYWYQKRIAKARSANAIKLSKPHKNFIQENRGEIPYSKALAKRILYGIGGILSGISSSVIENRKRTLDELIKDYNNVVKSMNDYIKFELNNECAEIQKSFWKDQFTLLSAREEQLNFPHFEEELVEATYPQCESNYEICSSNHSEVKKIFKKHFNLGELPYGWQPIGVVKPQKYRQLIDLENLCFLKYVQVKPIEDPGVYWINQKCNFELELIRNMPIEQREAIDRARFNNELIDIKFTLPPEGLDV